MDIIIKRFNELTVDELYDIYRLRCEVFIVEQNCPYLDIDDIDKLSYHILYKDKGILVAYLRVIPKGMYLNTSSIGRVIVKKDRRGEDLGLKILTSGINLVKDLKLDNEITIHAQTYALGFYEKCGFKAFGIEFLEDGIPHYQMNLKL